MKTIEACVHRLEPCSDDGNLLLTSSLTPISDNANVISTTTTAESSMTHRKRDRFRVRHLLDTFSSMPKCSF